MSGQLLQLARARVLVVGLAASGVAAAQALLQLGSGVRVGDDADSAELRARAEPLRTAGAELHLGALSPALLDDVDVVVASPGVPPHSRILVAATEAGVPVWSEPELAWQLAAGRTRVVAVTGTNGKTSTAELVGSCLRAPVAGNIGTPLVGVLAPPAGDPPPLVVAELSSFQLAFTVTFRPDVAVLLNVAPDHLDWHGGMDAYAAAKARMWARQHAPARVHPGDWAVIADDAGARATADAYPPPGRVALAATRRLEPHELPGVGVLDGWIAWQAQGSTPHPIVPVTALQGTGGHNLANACAAAAAAICAGANADALAEPLAAYRPGAHRLEHVATCGGVSWVNDSKATNPHAAAAALRAFPSVVWIAGGLNKGLDFGELAPVVAERVRAAVTIGSSGPELAQLTRGLGIHTVEAGQLEAAVRTAADLARPGDTVLLAPACASMDQFRSYAQRGEAFAGAVRRLVEADDGR